MRPRYLEIEGLQSFKDVQQVDFELLSETGLFGIFGPTGSGKSTILDAMTLALYGEVLRAVRGTQGIIHAEANFVRVSFTFDLLKSDGRRSYRVERLYKRKKGSENSAEAKAARLFEISDAGEQILADRPGDVTAQVETLIGLQLEDFTRTVVLPQNKFQEFLLLEKSKKREMLEKIFYLEEYGRQLSEKVVKKLSGVRHELSRIQGAISTLGDISEKILIEAESKMQAAKENKDRIDRELREVELAFQEAKELWGLSEEFLLLQEKEQKHLSNLAEISQKKEQYENSLKAVELKDFLTKYKETAEQLNNTSLQLDHVHSQLPALETALNEARFSYEAIRSDAESEKPRLIEQKTKVNQAIGIIAEIQNVDLKLRELREAYASIKTKLMAKDAEINKKRAAADELEKKMTELQSEGEAARIDSTYRSVIQAGIKLEDEYENSQQLLKSAQNQHDELKKKVIQLENALAQLVHQRIEVEKRLEEAVIRRNRHECEKAGDRNDIVRAMSDHHYVRSNFSSLRSKKSEYDMAVSRKISLQSQYEHILKSCAAADERKNCLQAVCFELKENLEVIKRQYEKSTAYILAKGLKEGEACPVCGSIHHPILANGEPGTQMTDLEQQLHAVEKRLASADMELREAENNTLLLAQQLKHQEAQLAQSIFDTSTKMQEYEQLLELMPEEIRKLDLDQMEAELNHMAVLQENRLKALDAWEQTLNELKEHEVKLNQEISGQQTEEHAKRVEFNLTQEQLMQAEKAFNTAAQDLNIKQQAFEKFKEKYHVNSACAEFKRIEECDKKVEALQKEITFVQLALKSASKQLECMLQERQELGNSFAAVEADGKNLKEQKMEREQKVKELIGDKDPAIELGTLDEKLQVLQRQEKEWFNRLKLLEEQFNKLQMLKNTLENQKMIYNSNFETEELRLRKALNEKGFSDADAAEKALLTKEHQEWLIRELEDYEQTGRNLQAQRNMLELKLNNRNITEEAWVQSNRIYMEKQQEKEASISAFEGAKNIYIHAKSSFGMWLNLNRELQEYSRKAEMLEQIQKLLKGNSFVEFIAEERLRYIAKEASETLGVLTKYKYALELDTESGFVIRDHMNGGVHRFVSSLSGGEMFLTSLSLALALSKQIQLKGQSPLEFFFLDEGFGTLDNNLLDTVIDSLERLSSRERVIGLISHVPELKNRMTRRLIVEPPSSDGRGSRVKVEKA